MTLVLGVLTGLLLQASPAPICGTVASYRTTGNSARGCAVILTLNVPATEAATKAVEVRIDDATRRQMGRPPWQFFQQEACVKGAFDSAYSMPTILVTNPSQVEIKGGAGAAAFGHDAVSGCDAAVTAPRLVKEAKPSYTADAMRDWVQGLVRVDAVVERDGTVSEARVTRSLHPQLDEEALKAIRKWRFEPGKVDGKPVRVVVDVEMTFTRR